MSSRFGATVIATLLAALACSDQADDGTGSVALAGAAGSGGSTTDSAGLPGGSSGSPAGGAAGKH